MSGIDYANAQVVKSDLKRLENLIPPTGLGSWVSAIKNTDQTITTVETNLTWSATYNVPDVGNRWALAGSGFRYTGSKSPANFLVQLSINLRKIGNNSNNAIRLNINGSMYQLASITTLVDRASDSHAVFLQRIVSMNTNDVLTIGMQNDTGNTDCGVRAQTTVGGLPGNHATLSIVEIISQ